MRERGGNLVFFIFSRATRRSREVGHVGQKFPRCRGCTRGCTHGCTHGCTRGHGRRVVASVESSLVFRCKTETRCIQLSFLYLLFLLLFLFLSFFFSLSYFFLTPLVPALRCSLPLLRVDEIPRKSNHLSFDPKPAKVKFGER